jgi:tRNA modification GTPase
MFATDDTIVAIATPLGRGALGVIRLSGLRASEISASLLACDTLQPRYATFTRVVHRPGGAERLNASQADPAAAVDEVVATFFRAPHSYTGEDVVEITAHGNPVVLRGIVRSAIEAGARLAEPGEFTLRAFLNGKRDLIQAEAVADLIDAATPLQARIAFDQLDGTLTERIGAIDAQLFDLIARLEASLDFPDEGYHFIEPSRAADDIGGVVAAIEQLLAGAAKGRLVREGARVVIAGRPNVGKSSIFNRLADYDRAIVTAIPGTTRDLVTETIDLGGIAITIVDTAGWRHTDDVVESEGVSRGERARAVADLILLILDRNEPLTADDRRLLDETRSMPRIVVLNKSDLPGRVEYAAFGPSVVVSARSNDGIDHLRDAIACALLGRDALRDEPSISNERHIALLDACVASLRTARDAAREENVPEEFLLADLQAARARLDEIVGRRTSEDVLRHIFERFCIGK